MLDNKVKLIDTKYNELIPHYEILGNEQSVDIEIDDSRARREEVRTPRRIVNHKGTPPRKSVSEFYGKESSSHQRLPSVNKYSNLLLKPLDVERKCQFTDRDRIIYSKENELYRSKSSHIPRKSSTQHWSVLRTSYSGFYFGPSNTQAVITFNFYDSDSRGKGVLSHLLNTPRQKSTKDTPLAPKVCHKKYNKPNFGFNNESGLDRSESKCGNKVLNNPTSIRKGTLTRVRHTRTGLEIDTGKLKVLYPEPDDKSSTLSDKENALPRVQSPSSNFPKKARVERWVENQRLLHRRCIQTA